MSIETQNLRDKKRRHDKMALVMLTMIGADILTPQEMAEPVIEEANKDSEAKEAWTDAIIVMENLTPAKRLSLLKALVVKYLAQVELLKLSQQLNDLNTDVLMHIADHHDERQIKPNMDALVDLLGEL